MSVDATLLPNVLRGIADSLKLGNVADKYDIAAIEQAADKLTAEREAKEKYLAVLREAGYERLEELLEKPIAFAMAVGAQAKTITKEIISKNEQLRARVQELERHIEEGREIVNDGVDLMTDEQVGKWAGVRGWLEGPIDAATSDQEPGS